MEWECHAWYVEHVNKKLNHINLCMDEISSFVEKIRPVFIVKKNDFDFSKYHIYLVGCKKKFCDDKNSDLFYYIKKKWFLMTKVQIYFVIYFFKKKIF